MTVWQLFHHGVPGQYVLFTAYYQSVTASVGLYLEGTQYALPLLTIAYLNLVITMVSATRAWTHFCFRISY